MTWGALVTSALGGVFVWSGLAKRIRPADWRQQAAAFGAPTVVAAALPWIELSLGACLIAQLWRPWPAVVAAGLLVVFTAAIAVRLSQGRRPPCACFGASARPIGPWTLVRNAVLVGVAVTAALSAV